MDSHQATSREDLRRAAVQFAEMCVCVCDRSCVCVCVFINNREETRYRSSLFILFGYF